MNNKQAKLMRKIAKVKADQQGLPPISYKTKITQKAVMVMNEFGKLVPQVVDKITRYMGNCECKVYQDIKKQFKEVI